MKVTFEWDEKQQYGGPIWVNVLMDGEPIAHVQWINGPPYLSAESPPFAYASHAGHGSIKKKELK